MVGDLLRRIIMEGVQVVAKKIPDFIFPSASLGSCNKRTALTDDIARCLQVHVRLELASLVCFLVEADI